MLPAPNRSFRDGRPTHQVLLAEVDAPGQCGLAMVNLPQHQRSGQQLEAAAHGKALVGAVAHLGARGGVVDAHAQPTAGPALDAGQFGTHPRRPSGRRVAGLYRAAQKAAGQQREQRAAANQGRLQAVDVERVSPTLSTVY
jgi:hypothetical protein